MILMIGIRYHLIIILIQIQRLMCIARVTELLMWLL